MRDIVGNDPARIAFFMAATGGEVGEDAAGRILARDVMALMGQRDPADIRKRLGAMRIAAASRARAGGGATGVTELSRRQPYARFFAVEEYDLTFRRFDGTDSPVVERAVFLSGDAATVLPYDPVRDRVLLIEQFRAGPWAREDPECWLLEVIAGRVDPDETPADAARREAAEEAGLTLDGMELVSEYYVSPGGKSEYVFSYVAMTDLPDRTEGVFGEASEAEDIRTQLLPFDEAMALMAQGRVRTAPLIMSLLWLQRERARLRA